MSTLTIKDDEELLNETFAALANPTRRAILARLSLGEASVNELAAPFDMSLPAISRHIRVLEKAGLVSQGKRAQYRPCTLAPEPIEAISNWTERYRHMWDERFDRMDDYLATIQSERSEQQTEDHVEREEQ